MLRAATGPWFRALAQCSIRIRLLYLVFQVAATSPAAKTSGTLVARNSSTTMPFSTVRPASLASSTRGVTPTPTTTRPPSMTTPSVVRTPLAAPSPTMASIGGDLHLSTQIEAIVGDGAASGVRTTDGVVIEGDLVVVGVGVTPRVELAKLAGLTVENGIVVDEFLATSVPDVFAAGDVAATWNTRYNKRIRMEHWANALNQGPVAARNMLGQHTAYEKLPYFYSDQYDLGMEYNGYADDWDRVVVRGDRSGQEFLAFWLKDGRVLAGMNANIWDQGDDIKALIRSGASVDPDRRVGEAVRVDA